MGVLDNINNKLLKISNDNTHNSKLNSLNRTKSFDEWWFDRKTCENNQDYNSRFASEMGKLKSYNNSISCLFIPGIAINRNNIGISTSGILESEQITKNTKIKYSNVPLSIEMWLYVPKLSTLLSSNSN